MAAPNPYLPASLFRSPRDPPLSPPRCNHHGSALPRLPAHCLSGWDPHVTTSGPSAILFPFSLSTSGLRRRRRRLEHTGSKRSEVLVQLGTRGACLSRSLQPFALPLSTLVSVASGPHGCGLHALRLSRQPCPPPPLGARTGGY